MSEGNGQVTAEAQVLAKDSEGVVELRAVELDIGAGGSTQPEEDEWGWLDTIEPPEDVVGFGRLTKVSAVRDRCLDALTRNTVGLGWDVAVWPEHEGDVDRARVRECRHRLDALARRDKRLDRPSFSTLISAVKHDVEEYGTGYLEASRNRRSGQIDGLFHAPGQLVRRKRDRTGYVIGQSAGLADGAALARTDYYNFGEKVEYDRSGAPVGRLASGATRWGTNELIAFRHFTSESRDYGLPRDQGLIIEYAAAKFVDEWTAGFFQGSGVPPTMMFVSGQEQREGGRVTFKVDASVMRRINQAMASDGPPGRRVAVIPVPPGTNINAETLSELSDRDITFEEFRKQHRRNVGSSFGLMPIFYGDVDDAGRYTAEVQRSLTLEETFDPDQTYIEDKLWTTLLADLGYSELRVQFKRLAIEGDAAKREVANNAADRGAITVGEYRQMNGLEPLPYDGDPNDEENPNNKLMASKTATAPPHDPVDQRSQDERGMRPGIGGRGPGRDGQIAKHDHPAHVEDAVDELADELSEYGPVAADG